jgi:hypothetical protein
MHFHKIFTTLLGYPPGLLKKGLAKGLQALAAVITGIVDSGQFLVNGFIYLDPSGFNVFLEEFMH